ncbi:MAG TPA: hypothetical protein DHW71_00400, partial [Gammaproteobacteria bacterium]|nr:hypothetical protein [Gammaproteobacteria bacterium]
LNSKGQDRCPEQAAWMRKHSQDFNIPHVQLAASLGQPEILTLNHSDADLVSKFAVLKDMRVCQK